MVEPKRNQGAFQKPVDKSAAVSGHQHQFACIVDQNLDRRPDIEHKNTDADISDCADDRDKMCSAKKRKNPGQFNFVKTVMQCGNAKPDNDAAENTHLQGRNANNFGGCTGEKRMASARISYQTSDGTVHNKESNNT